MTEYEPNYTSNGCVGGVNPGNEDAHVFLLRADVDDDALFLVLSEHRDCVGGVRHEYAHDHAPSPRECARAHGAH